MSTVSKQSRKPKRSRKQSVAARRFEDLHARYERPRARRRAARRRELKRRMQIAKAYLHRRKEGKLEKNVVQEVAGEMGCSVATVRRYAKRYREEGKAALMPTSSRPQTIHYQLTVEVRMLVVTFRALLGWGGRRLVAEFQRRGLGTLSHTSAYRIFRAHHLPIRRYHPQARCEGIAYRRYQRAHPDDLWHIDFKGPLKGGTQKLYGLVIVDDYSRYCLGATGGSNCTAQVVIDALRQAFLRYGAPRELMTDNGRAFTSVWEEGNHVFDEFLRPYGLEHLTIPPYYPEANGKAEAFIKILHGECLSLIADQVQTQQDFQKMIDDYVRYYNNYRAHGSLDYKPPVARYLRIEPKVQGVAGIWGLPDLGCPWLAGFAESPPSPVKSLMIVK